MSQVWFEMFENDFIVSLSNFLTVLSTKMFSLFASLGIVNCYITTWSVDEIKI